MALNIKQPKIGRNAFMLLSAEFFPTSRTFILSIGTSYLERGLFALQWWELSYKKQGYVLYVAGIFTSGNTISYIISIIIISITII